MYITEEQRQQLEKLEAQKKAEEVKKLMSYVCPHILPVVDRLGLRTELEFRLQDVDAAFDKINGDDFPYYSRLNSGMLIEYHDGSQPERNLPLWECLNLETRYRLQEQHIESLTKKIEQLYKLVNWKLG